ncbi:MAG: signal peptidase II [Clostridia bacterium]|nr:signal peptidase II [Clostridia bacterium]
MFLWSLIVVLIIAVDQLSKYWVVNNIGMRDSVSVIPKVIDFVYVKNTGAAFSFLSDKNYGIVILSIISVLFSVGVILFMIKYRPKNKLLSVSLALMLSGAIGNVIDRIFRGYVVDFIEMIFIDFPVINIADIAITFGAAMIIIYVLFFDKAKNNVEQER